MARVPAAQAPTGAGPLARYHAKRDFTRTSEPEGKAPAWTAGKGALRFVVQKHAARRLHYDLRLELDGVMKSWAVTRGPSLDPADKRLAVEDHPLDYRTFEGTIDEGYGAGTVMVWDQGTWQPDPEIDDPRAALEAGNLKFILHGERLCGSWDLVRMKPRPKERQPQWLLIKRHDSEERPGEGGRLAEETITSITSITSGRTMEQIAEGDPPKKGRRARQRSPRRQSPGRQSPSRSVRRRTSNPPNRR